jgi:hypothetical protein
MHDFRREMKREIGGECRETVLLSCSTESEASEERGL